MDTRETLAWFDVFDWPLTPAESSTVYCLPPTADHPNTHDAVVGSRLAVVSTDGFLHLPGRAELALLRRRKGVWSWRKLRRALRWARPLRFVPFVRMIAVGNALGYGNCREESDIDLVIVAAPHRVWFVRLFVVGMLRIFRQRPGEHTRDALCPSFFLTTEALNLESLQLRADSSSFIIHHSSFPPDPYLLFWPTQLTVLYDERGTYARFWDANAAWVRRWLSDAVPRAMHPRFSLQPSWWSWGKRIRERLLGGRAGDALELWCRRFQAHRLPAELRTLANCDTRVILTDRMLKFHANDRRAQFRDAWLERLDRTP